MLKLVPFDPAFADPAQAKLDVHAIYRRPRYIRNQWDEIVRDVDVNGIPTWDLTTPLPCRNHHTWARKGFEYITLADMASLQMAAPFLAAKGLNARDYIQHPEYGPWNYKKFLAGSQVAYHADVDRLREDIAKFGAEAVERIRQQTDPDYRLPAAFHLPAPARVVDVESTQVASTEAVPAQRPVPLARRRGRPRKVAEVVA
jgi:hypothetical protein